MRPLLRPYRTGLLSPALRTCLDVLESPLEKDGFRHLAGLKQMN